MSPPSLRNSSPKDKKGQDKDPKDSKSKSNVDSGSDTDVKAGGPDGAGPRRSESYERRSGRWMTLSGDRRPSEVRAERRTEREDSNDQSNKRRTGGRYSTRSGKVERRMSHPDAPLIVARFGTQPTQGQYYKNQHVAKIADQIRRSKHFRSKTIAHKPWYLIDPRTSPRIGLWDVVTTIALVFTMIVTPFEVGFVPIPQNRWVNPLFLINRLVDIIFICDMGVQFLLMYNRTDTSGSGDGRWVIDPREIAWHYVTSPWFTLDFFSIAASLFDIFAPDDNETLTRLTALRALRVLRLLKLLRLVRGSRIFKRWEIRLSINYALLQICSICLMLVFICHLFACVWGLQASFDPLNSWLGYSGYCIPWNATADGPCPELMVEGQDARAYCNSAEGWACAGPAEQCASRRLTALIPPAINSTRTASTLVSSSVACLPPPSPSCL
jgi:uncharacterized protein (DUF1330 family)